MSINKKNELKMTAFLLATSYSSLFWFADRIPVISKLYSSDVTNILTIIAALILISNKVIKIGKIRIPKDSTKVLYAVFLIFVTNIIYCIIRYGESPIHTIFKTYYLLTPIILTIALSMYIRTEDEYCYFMQILTKIIIFIAILTLLQLFLGQKSIYFWNIQNSQFRYGSYRITVAVYLQAFCAIYLFNECLQYKRCRDILGLSIIIASLSFGAKIRALILYLLISFYFIYWIRSGKHLNIKKIRIFLFVAFLIGIAVYIERGVIVSFFYEAGISVRFEAIRYYVNQWIRSPLFGQGNFRVANNIELNLLDRGPFLNYYHDDVGIIGFLNYFGLVGIISLVYILLNLYKKIKKSRTNYSFVARGSLIFVCLGFISMNIMDSARIAVLSLLIIECLVDGKSVYKL